MTNQTDLSIVVVNWKSSHFLQKCLSSIYANAKEVNFEILVVDNASFDGSAEMVRREFPEVRFIQSEENLGFAKANNLGFRHSIGRDILFLNPDTEAADPAFKTMLAFLRSTPDAGAVGCKLLNSDFTVQTSCVQKYPTLLNQFLDSEWLRRLFPRANLWGTQALLDARGGPAPVEVVSGACLMMRREVFEALGQFSTDYFMYAEDTDLCYRAQKAGYRNYYVGQVTVIHHGGVSSDSAGENNFASIVMQDSLWKLLRKHRGPLYAAAYRATAALKAVFRIAILLGVLVLTAGQFQRARVIAALAKWAKVLRWAFGLEGWLKELAHKARGGDDLLEVAGSGQAQTRRGAPLRSR